MDKRKRKRLEAAGFAVEEDAGAFLGLTDEDRRVIELRLAVSRAVRSARESRDMTQADLAAKLGSSQSRVAKVEAGANGVSLDLAFRALFAAGGGLSDLVGAAERTR